MLTGNSYSFSQPQSPFLTGLLQLRTSIIMMARTPVNLIRRVTPSRNTLFGSPASSNVCTEAGATMQEKEHEPEVWVSSNEGQEMEQDREIKGSRTEIQRSPTNQRNRRMSIVPDPAMGVLIRKSDRLQQSRQGNSSEHEEDRKRFLNCEQGYGIETHDGWNSRAISGSSDHWWQHLQQHP